MVADRAGYPGLLKEYKSPCTEFNLPIPSTISKQRWKNMVKKAIYEANKNNLLTLIKSKYQKLDYDIVKNEKYEMKDYVKNLYLHEGRMKFQIRSKMVKTVAFNFSSDPKFSSQLWQCSHCDKMDSQSHILICDSYKPMREGKDLNCDKDLVAYFKDVISLREKLEDIV